jgi:hypothetical protein
MNIHTVRDNLKNTIAGKEKMLAGIKNPDDMFNMEARMVAIATREFLEINIDELKRILKDVEVCCEQHTEMGWQINPERMGQ